MKELDIQSADKYKIGEYDTYEFPFKVLDDTVGGSNLGRIEICVELFRSKKKQNNQYYIEKIWVWFKQTRDEKYKGKIFEIPCHTESITGDRLNNSSYTQAIWRMFYCSEHKQFIMEAYPKNNQSKLRIDAFSSVSVDIDLL